MTIRASIDAVLGYLVCGFLLLAACEAAFEGTWLIERDWHLGAQVVFGTIALCGGWSISRIGLALLERKLVCGCLQTPECILLADPSRGIRGWRRILFRGYYRPLPDETRERILEAAERHGFTWPAGTADTNPKRERGSQVAPSLALRVSVRNFAGGRGADRSSGTALFRDALANVEQEPAIMRRVDRSRQLSDICRGLCVGFMVASAILFAGIIWHGLYSRWSQADLRKLGYCLLCLWESLLMLHRYLKFRRQYAVEVLTGYAAM